MQTADSMAARLAYQNPLEVADAIRADRAAVALAAKRELLEELCANEHGLFVAYDVAVAKYQKDTP